MNVTKAASISTVAAEKKPPGGPGARHVDVPPAAVRPRSACGGADAPGVG